MMRILAVTNLYPNPWQPFRAPFNRQQFAALGHMHPLHIIAPVAWTAQLRSRHSQTDEQQSRHDNPSVTHPSFVFPPGILRSKHGNCYLRSVRAAFDRAIAEFKPTVLLASWAYPDGWAALQLARQAGLPLAIKVHGSDILLLRPTGARRQLTIDALTGADAVSAVSRQLANRVSDLGIQPKRIHVVHNGVDSARFHPGSATDARAKLQLPEGPIALFVGNLVHVKGPDVLIRSCADLRDRGVNIRCVLIGDGPLRRSLAREIRRLRLADRVILLGPRPLQQLPDWYRAANLLVLPSRSEGYPNVALEALACGTPIVATNVGGIPEILDPHSLIPPDDPRALADAISQTLTFPSRIASRAVSWSDSAAQLASVLALAIAQHNTDQNTRVAA